MDNPYLFQGRRWDAESKLYYYRNRYYDPGKGRFVSRDPMGIWYDVKQFGSGYSYLSYNPLVIKDPFGTDPWYGYGYRISGMLGVLGYESWYGTVINLHTGEECRLKIGCTKLGVGLGGSFAYNATIKFSGPSKGRWLDRDFPTENPEKTFYVDVSIGPGVIGTLRGQVGIDAPHDVDNPGPTGIAAGFGLGLALRGEVGIKMCWANVEWCKPYRCKKKKEKALEKHMPASSPFTKAEHFEENKEKNKTSNNDKREYDYGRPVK